jgi:hypothetical protein
LKSSIKEDKLKLEKIKKLEKRQALYATEVRCCGIAYVLEKSDEYNQMDLVLGINKDSHLVDGKWVPSFNAFVKTVDGIREFSENDMLEIYGPKMIKAIRKQYFRK